MLIVYANVKIHLMWQMGMKEKKIASEMPLVSLNLRYTGELALSSDFIQSHFLPSRVFTIFKLK